MLSGRAEANPQTGSSLKSPEDRERGAVSVDDGTQRLGSLLSRRPQSDQNKEIYCLMFKLV